MGSGGYDKSEATVVLSGPVQGAGRMVRLAPYHSAASTFRYPNVSAVWVSPWTAPYRSTAMLTTFAKQRFTTFVHYDKSESSSRPTTQRTLQLLFVGSRLDYCNSLLYGVSDTNLNKLQQVQNSLARIVLGSDTRSSTMQNLADLHWLPVRARIIGYVF